MWVQLALVACYTPYGIAAELYANGVYHEGSLLATLTLLYLNSSLSPILYSVLENNRSETSSKI